MNVKMTFTIPEDIAGELSTTIRKSKRSSFVASALAEKLKAIRDEEFRQELIRGYIETREEDRLIDQEWEAATLEGWP